MVLEFCDVVDNQLEDLRWKLSKACHLACV